MESAHGMGCRQICSHGLLGVTRSQNKSLLALSGTIHKQGISVSMKGGFQGPRVGSLGGTHSKGRLQKSLVCGSASPEDCILTLTVGFT